MGLKPRIWALRQGFGPCGWDLGLEAGIWASSLGFCPQGWGFAAGYPTILRNLGFWVRKLTFLGFLADFTKGK